MISLLQSLVFSTVALASHKHSAWCCTSLWDLLPAPAGALSGILKGEAKDRIQGHVWVNAQEHLGVEAEAQGCVTVLLDCGVGWFCSHSGEESSS